MHFEPVVINYKARVPSLTKLDLVIFKKNFCQQFVLKQTIYLGVYVLPETKLIKEINNQFAVK